MKIIIGLDYNKLIKIQHENICIKLFDYNMDKVNILADLPLPLILELRIAKVTDIWKQQALITAFVI